MNNARIVAALALIPFLAAFTSPSAGSILATDDSPVTRMAKVKCDYDVTLEFDGAVRVAINVIVQFPDGQHADSERTGHFSRMSKSSLYYSGSVDLTDVDYRGRSATVIVLYNEDDGQVELTEMKIPVTKSGDGWRVQGTLKIPTAKLPS